MATMYKEPENGEARRMEVRKGRRSSMSLPATILLFGQRHSVQLHNLSCNGAMIQSAVPVRSRDEIVLTCGTIEARGSVVWTKGRSFGVEFHVALEEEEIVRQLYRSNAVLRRRDLRQMMQDK